MARFSRVRLAQAEQILMAPGRTSQTNRDLPTRPRSRSNEARGSRVPSSLLRYQRNERRSSTHILDGTRAFYSLARRLVSYLTRSSLTTNELWQLTARGSLEYAQEDNNKSIRMRVDQYPSRIFSGYAGHVAAPKRMTSCVAVNHK